MIKESSVTNALPSASAIVALGKVASARPGTIIGELVRLSASVEVLDVNGKVVESTKAPTGDAVLGGALTSFAFNVEYATMGSMESPSPHSLEMDAHIRDISKVVAQHVAHAKNVVRPIVTAFAEELHTFLANAKPREAGEAAIIKTLRLPAVLKDESFLDTLSAFKGKTLLTPDVSFSLENKSKEELDALVLVGHARTDKLIVEWLSHLPDAFLSNVWNSFFSKGGVQMEGSMIYRYDDLNRLNAFAKADVSLAIVLLARKITGDVQATNMELARYQTMCNQYVEYGSVLLIDALAKISLSIRTKNIIVDKDYAKLEVSVNGETYPQWLASGGSPEIILGVLISNASASSQNLIDEKRDQYLSSWNSYCTFYRTREVNNSFTYAKNHIENMFVSHMQTLTESEQEFVKGQPNLIELVCGNVRDIVHTYIKPDDLKDPYAIALLLIARTRFYYTSSYQILSDINEASKINPNVDVREAALLAVINYVSDFVADQISLG